MTTIDALTTVGLISMPLIIWLLSIIIILLIRYHACQLAKTPEIVEIYKSFVSRDLSASISIMIFIYMVIAAMVNEKILIGLLFTWLSFKAVLWFRGQRKKVNNDD